MNAMAQRRKCSRRKDGGVGWMIFNNPERHNAMSLEMWEAAPRSWTTSRADARVRVVVLTGAGGKAFVSGADISQVRASERSASRGGRALQGDDAEGERRSTTIRSRRSR